ncbi:MAG TPA: hypothetical protein VFB62_04255 [Polyangiaceae bacterium]|jgi:hypothetical protein|nr:hypothetical protein [Polyangiaceae bacterium]
MVQAGSVLWRIVVVLVACLAIGCGGGAPKGKTANVKSGSMPSGGDWTGVWYSPLFGELHMQQEGNRVEGRWQRPRKGEWGKLMGNTDGNLMRFDWEEFVDGLVGPNSKRKGKGYFVYTRPEGDNVDDVIKGEVGRGADEVGIEWTAVKQRNVKVNLASIGGSGSGEVGGGDWDQKNQDEGEPEEPSEPESPEEGPPEP